MPAVRAQEYNPTFECLGCGLRLLCAQCPAAALSEIGNLETRVPFLCQLAHLRREAFDPAERRLEI